jgi:glycosyltransferase involved in cell wall biosynthesis
MRREESPPRPLVALLGRRDEPTDALRDYCACLARALGKRGVSLALAEMAWEKDGWLRAFWRLWKQSADWRGTWTLLQYTALMWSRRGLPLAVPLVLAILQARNAKVAVVFHDLTAYPGQSWINRARIRFQVWMMRWAYHLADRAIVTVPVECVPWLPDGAIKAEFIPVGANVPAWEKLARDLRHPVALRFPTVAVFGMSSLPAVREREIQAIVEAIRQVSQQFPGIRLLVMGRGTAEAEPLLRQRLKETEIELDVKGLLPGEEVSRLLASSDVMLFVRGPVSSRRGSALAGIACGLPVVAYHGPETGFPLTEAGVLLGPYEDLATLPKNLMRVLEDEELRQRLRARSLEAYRQWFAWGRIADRLVETLGITSGGAAAESTEAGAETQARASPTEVMQSEAYWRGREATINVLICSHSFYPVPGGAQEYTRLLAEGLASAGQMVRVATETPAPPNDDRRYSFEVFRQPNLRSLWPLIGEADVVQLAGPVLLPLFLSILRGKPVVIEHHGYQAACPNGLLLYEPTKSICPGHFLAGRYHDCLRCNTAASGWLKSLPMLILAFARRWLSQLATVNAPITRHVQERLRLPRSRVIYYGIAPPSGSDGSGARTAPPRDSTCFAYVGRLVTEKGLLLLLEAAERLKAEGCDFRLKFIGDGPERACLESLAAAKGLQNHVSFTGYLTGESLESATGDVAALVMPSIWEEAAGLAAMEQMTRGRIVVAADVGGLGEVVGDSGLKFPVGDVAALIVCLKRVLDQPTTVRELGQKARERAMRMFQQERMVKEHLDVYRTAVREAKA